MIFNYAKDSLFKVMPVLQKTIVYSLQHKKLNEITFNVDEYNFDGDYMEFDVFYDGNRGGKVQYTTLFAFNGKNEPCLFGESISQFQILGANAHTAKQYTDLIEVIPDAIGFYGINDKGLLVHKFGFGLPNCQGPEMCTFMHSFLTACILGGSIPMYARYLA